MDITIRDDFDLTKIAESGQCFRWRQMPDGGYRVIYGDRCLYIRRTGEARYLLDCDEAAFEAVWRDYFDLGEDYRAIRSRIDPAGDPFPHDPRICRGSRAEGFTGPRTLPDPPRGSP